MTKLLLSFFRVLFLLCLTALMVGIAVTFMEIRAVTTDHDKREGVVVMLTVIFLGGAAVFATWMLSKYFERKASV